MFGCRLGYLAESGIVLAQKKDISFIDRSAHVSS
jgi:hypothetical protein